MFEAAVRGSQGDALREFGRRSNEDGAHDRYGHRSSTQHVVPIAVGLEEQRALCGIDELGDAARSHQGLMLSLQP